MKRSIIFLCSITALVFLKLFFPGTSGAFQNANLNVKDSVEMVLVPGGVYLMGSNSGFPDQRPKHEVYINAFYIDTHEVTNKQYQKFLKETGHPKPAFWFPDIDRPDEPVVGVKWSEASAYAKWAGKRLPTEAEWEYAARGGTIEGRFYWGDEPDFSYANLDSFGIAPVKSFKPNGYGLYDMIGNVWEWCSDWYDRQYYSTSPRENPQGPPEGKSKVLRGGAWYCPEHLIRIIKRYNSNPAAVSYSFGFRCVKSAE